MRSSSSQCSSRSFDETSALFPIGDERREPEAARGRLRRAARGRALRSASRRRCCPAGSAPPANVPFSGGSASAMPMQFGPTQARAVGADEREQLVLARLAFGPQLGEAGRDHADRARPVREAPTRRSRARPPRGRRRTARSTGPGSSANDAYPRLAVHRGALAVDGVERRRESPRRGRCERARRRSSPAWARRRRRRRSTA